jgi:hypothetical protein
VEIPHAAQETDNRLNFSIKRGIKNTSNVDEIAPHPLQLNFVGKQKKQI